MGETVPSEVIKPTLRDADGNEILYATLGTTLEDEAWADEVEYLAYGD